MAVVVAIGFNCVLSLGCWYLAWQLTNYHRWLVVARGWLAEAQALSEQLPELYLLLLQQRYRILKFDGAYRDRAAALARGQQLLTFFLWLVQLRRF